MRRAKKIKRSKKTKNTTKQNWKQAQSFTLQTLRRTQHNKMEQRSECQCAWKMLALHQHNKYSEKTIKKALHKTMTTLEVITTDLPGTEIINEAANALISYYKDNLNTVPFEHNCVQAQNMAEQIKDALNTIDNNKRSNDPIQTTLDVTMNQTDMDEYKKEIEVIKTHYYKRKVLKFRCLLKGYDIIVTEEVNEIMNNPEIAKAYLRKQTSKAISTMITRAPALIQLLKRTSNEGTNEAQERK